MAADEQKTKWVLILGIVVGAILIYTILISAGVLNEPEWMFRMRNWTDELD